MKQIVVKMQTIVLHMYILIPTCEPGTNECVSHLVFPRSPCGGERGRWRWTERVWSCPPQWRCSGSGSQTGSRVHGSLTPATAESKSRYLHITRKTSREIKEMNVVMSLCFSRKNLSLLQSDWSNLIVQSLHVLLCEWILKVLEQSLCQYKSSAHFKHVF